MAKRKPLSQKIRFEVFKRDSFRCQYCGRSAPEVILEVDHIVPVAEGGGNDILNLVTSCRECNRGKMDRTLDDNSTVMKQKHELDDINERMIQLKMMQDWREQLKEINSKTIDFITKILHEYAPYNLSEKGKAEVLAYVERFGIEEVCTAIDISFKKYFDEDDPENSYEVALIKVGGICYNRKKAKESGDNYTINVTFTKEEAKSFFYAGGYLPGQFKQTYTFSEMYDIFKAFFELDDDIGDQDAEQDT